MDQETRNTLRNAVVRLRELLEEDARRQLESTYGILVDKGSVLPLDQVPPLKRSAELRRRREEIQQAIARARQYVAGAHVERQAMEHFVREAAFTSLNRLSALKLMEARGLIPECVAKGPDSQAFREFRQVVPVLAEAHSDHGYRLFLELLYDDASCEIAVLFDRTLPPSHLFPDTVTLQDVLVQLNADELASVWSVDETLGWIYQYFTPKQLREKARQESPAPRNSYELAFLNQFYTPDYVVRFLVENTLGRLWWEMDPATALAEREYFVRTPDEKPTARDPRDPRSLRVLDPACGSGHFLHYSFELLQVIYAEAYAGHPAGEALREAFPDAAEFARAVPGLILEHNLFGIDIDLRSTQLTALTLYLRAKRLDPKTQVRRVNAVLAAPMPGDKALFEEFLAGLSAEQGAPILTSLLRQMWEELDLLAAEAGSLLKAEVALREKIETARRQAAKARSEGSVLDLFDESSGKQAMVATPDEAFWDRAEQRLLELLGRYAEQAAAEGIARRLFAEDAAHGIAFLDTLLHPYDVVLMNPPFGAPSKPSKAYIDKTYPRTKNDVYAAFVERGLELLRPRGFLGAITSRTGFFLTSFQKWREEILLKETDIITFADLGAGVLDTAMVETAAYVLENTRQGGPNA